jgi:hypothetical protein
MMGFEMKKIIIQYLGIGSWGGLSSLDKLGNKDKSVYRHCKWRLSSSDGSTDKQAADVSNYVQGATADGYKYL